MEVLIPQGERCGCERCQASRLTGQVPQQCSHSVAGLSSPCCVRSSSGISRGPHSRADLLFLSLLRSLTLLLPPSPPRPFHPSFTLALATWHWVLRVTSWGVFLPQDPFHLSEQSSEAFPAPS